MNRWKARSRYDWTLRSRTLALGECTRVMAIVKLTVESEPAVAAAVEAFDRGAEILDLGAESARAGGAVSAEEEQARLLPVLDAVLRARPAAIVSVDAFHAVTALAAAKLGAEIVNDLSGLSLDPAMGAAVAETGCGLVLMHTRGRTRESLGHGPMSRDEVVRAVFSGLCESIAMAEATGTATERIVIDPGFGFGKRGVENFTLLAQLGRLNQLGRPIVIGLSRKSFLGETVRPLQSGELPIAEARRTATIAANTAAILAGAHILRVHDVQAAKEAAAVADAVLESSE